MKVEKVMWICTTAKYPVGVVKTFDEIEGRHKYYIGLGLGRDEEEDIQLIVDLGQKYNSMDFLTSL